MTATFAFKTSVRTLGHDRKSKQSTYNCITGVFICYRQGRDSLSWRVLFSRFIYLSFTSIYGIPRCTATAPDCSPPATNNLRSKPLFSDHCDRTYFSDWLVDKSVPMLLYAMRLSRPEGRGFDSPWSHWNFTPSGCTMALGPTQFLTEISTRDISCAVMVAGT